jgi:hypothetical protein
MCRAYGVHEDRLLAWWRAAALRGWRAAALRG